MNAAAVSIPSAPAGESPSLPWSAKLFYGVGEIPITVTMVMFGLFAMFFYTSVMGLSPALVGVGIGAGLVVDAFVDPFIGYRSDHSRGRLGRRHGFMLAGAVAMGPCFVFLFSPPRGMSAPVLFSWLLLWSIAFRATSAVYRIPYLSLGAELTQDYVERTRVISIRALFGLAGTLASAALSLLLFFPPAGGADPKLHYASYPKLGLVFGAVMTAAGLVTFLGTLRQRDLPHGDPPSSSARDFFAGFRLAMANRAFRCIWFSFVLFFLAVVLNAVVALQYFTWYARIHEGKALSAIQASFYIGALIGVMCWLGLARKGEKHKIYLAATLGMAALLCMAAVFIGPGRPFGTGSVLPLVLGHLVAGLLASAVWVFPGSMMADVADQDELSSGQRREGIYFGILSFGEKIASGGALFVAGMLLHFFVRLVPGSATQTPGTVERLGLLYGPVPGVALAVAALLILPYSLNRHTVLDIQHSLAERRRSEARG